jgi:hypothetical protein
MLLQSYDIYLGVDLATSKAVKIKIYKMMVKPVVMYGSETWPITVMDMKRLNTWERKILRIYGPVVKQEIWRIRTNQELQELHKDLDIVADIKKKGLEWIGHLISMDHVRVVKKIFESKLKGGRGGQMLKQIYGIGRLQDGEKRWKRRMGICN